MLYVAGPKKLWGRQGETLVAAAGFWTEYILPANTHGLPMSGGRTYLPPVHSACTVPHRLTHPPGPCSGLPILQLAQPSSPSCVSLGKTLPL